MDELRKVIDVYALSVANDISELEDALKNADADKARMKKHALQTAFGYLGMSAAIDILLQVEAGRADYQELLGRVASEWQRTLPHIKERVAKK